MSAANIYEIVTERILSAIESTGVLPWKKPWKTYSDGSCYPRSLASGKCYQGINVLLLGLQYYESPFWLTWKQCNERGGQVKLGERGSIVIYWKLLERTTVENGERKITKIPMLRYSTVFNATQCEGLEYPGMNLAERAEAERLEACEAMVSRYAGRPEVQHFRNCAAYSPVTDTIMMPGITSFTSSEEYYSTLFHEFVHSTGHTSRLNRPDLMALAGKQSEEYGREELVAEIGASFLCAETGISPATVDNSLGYVQGWARTIRANPKLVVEAASQAQKAVDLIAGRRVPVQLAA